VRRQEQTPGKGGPSAREWRVRRSWDWERGRQLDDGEESPAEHEQQWRETKTTIGNKAATAWAPAGSKHKGGRPANFVPEWDSDLHLARLRYTTAIGLRLLSLLNKLWSRVASARLWIYLSIIPINVLVSVRHRLKQLVSLGRLLMLQTDKSVYDHYFVPLVAGGIKS